MAGLMTALALRESGVFTTIDVFEQTRTPSTAGAGLNIPPNAARLSRWLGVDLDGGDAKGPDGAVDGGRAAILHETRMVWEDGSITRKPLDHNTSAGDNAGFHHMHRLDLLMCLYKRVLEFAPETGVNCPIQVHMAKRLDAVNQDEESVTVTFSDGTVAHDIVVPVRIGEGTLGGWTEWLANLPTAGRTPLAGAVATPAPGKLEDALRLTSGARP